MLRRRVLVLVLALALLAACKKEVPAEAPKAPEAAPAAGKADVPAPVTSAFVRLEGEGEAARAVVRFTSTADKAVERLALVMRFLSVDDRELGRRPWTQSGPAVVPAQGEAELTLGVALPAGTAKVEAIIAEARFTGGESWRGTDLKVAKPRSGKRPASFKLNNVEHLRPTTRAEAAVRVAPRPMPVRGAATGTETAPGATAPAAPDASAPAPAPFVPKRPPITR